MKKFILGITSLIVMLGSTNPHIIGNKDDKMLEYSKTNMTSTKNITKDTSSCASSNKNLISTSSENKIEKTLKCSTTTGNFNTLFVKCLINDIVLKDSKDSNINITLNCIGEGKDKEKLTKIFNELELKIPEENNQYAPIIYRSGKNLIITTDEMKNINYIHFNLIIEIPKTLKSMTLSNLGSVSFDILKLDKLEISSKGDVKGTNITAKECNISSYNGLIEVGNFNSDTLYIRTNNKLKSKEITSKDCTVVNRRGVTEVDKFNCDKLNK